MLRIPVRSGSLLKRSDAHQTTPREELILGGVLANRKAATLPVRALPPGPGAEPRRFDAGGSPKTLDQSLTPDLRIF